MVRQVAELLTLSDERDTWLRRLDTAHRVSFELGCALGVAVGRRQVLDEEAAAQRAVAGMVLAGDLRTYSQIEAARWTVRGQRRTRETFGQPHPGDYLGRGAA